MSICNVNCYHVTVEVFTCTSRNPGNNYMYKVTHVMYMYMYMYNVACIYMYMYTVHVHVCGGIVVPGQNEWECFFFSSDKYT